MKKIAIKGHPTRGEDIIKILKSLGGINERYLKGTQPEVYYYLKDHNYIRCKSYSVIMNEYDCYTLEEYEQKFLNTMKNIAIHGHSTRNKDIIKTLESLGGNNTYLYKGNSTDMYYYINDANQIDCDPWEYIEAKYKTYTIEEYEQIQNNMEKRNIQIDITTARDWYKQGGDLKKVALQAFSEKELRVLPASWKEYCEINPYLIMDKEFFLAPDGTVNNITQKCYRRVDFTLAMSSKKRAEQFVVLSKLIQIRDYYNQDWEPDWTNTKQEKYVIGSAHNELFIDVFLNVSHIFSFKTRELVNEFFENFKEDLEFIKEFL